MNTQIWIQYFEGNLTRFKEPPLPVNASSLPDAIKIHLARSLAVFQLGESGGGTRLMRYVRGVVEKDHLPGYEQAVQLFIAEEQYHAALLEKLVRHLGAPLLTKQWTNSVFRGLRSLLGIEFNIQILLIAELIAEVYYGLIYRKSSDPVLRACCHKILSDEMRHIAFHTGFLRERLETFPGWRRVLWRMQFWSFHRIIALVVAWDHRDCFRALGVRPVDVVRMAAKTCGRFLRRLQKPQTLWNARLDFHGIISQTAP